MADKTIQQDELYALKCIYDNEFDVDANNTGGTYYGAVNLPSSLKLIWKDLRFRGNVKPQEMTVQFLPPVTLSFQLPNDYPSVSPPTFTISCSWLRKDQLSKLCLKLDAIWKDSKGSEVLFSWTSFLKEELLDYLQIGDKIDLSILHTFELNASQESKKDINMSKPQASGAYALSCQKTVAGEKETELGEKRRNDVSTMDVEGINVDPLVQKTQSSFNSSEIVEFNWQPDVEDVRAVCEKKSVTLIVLLTEYNRTKLKEAFQRQIFTCKICFSVVTGSQCIRFEPCGHVFCQSCIKDYFEVYIREGTVQNILCPEMKCSSVVYPSQVKELISPEMFALYDKLLLNATLDTMTDIIYCPLASCQYPVIREPNEKMATCPICRYAFCVFCKMVYHGVEPCRYKSNEKQQLVKEYQNASPQRRLELEHRYGKKQLRLLVDSTMSEEWINSHSKNCPHCKAAIEKSDGCNKMTCWNCKTNFCWLCMSQLNQKNPYEHYTSSASRCVDKLFHGIVLENDEYDANDAPINMFANEPIADIDNID